MTVRFGFRQQRSKKCAVQDIAGEPVCRVALDMFEEMTINLKRDGRVGVSESMLHFRDGRARRDHCGRAAVAKRVEGHSTEASSRESRIEGDAQQPIPANRFAVEHREYQFVLRAQGLQFPSLQIGNEKSWY